MISPPTKPKNLPGGQQGQGHEVVLLDECEDYQQPKTFGSWINSIPQGVKEVSQFQISNWDQNLINLLEIGPIPFLGLSFYNHNLGMQPCYQVLLHVNCKSFCSVHHPFHIFLVKRQRTEWLNACILY